MHCFSLIYQLLSVRTGMCDQPLPRSLLFAWFCAWTVQIGFASAGALVFLESNSVSRSQMTSATQIKKERREKDKSKNSHAKKGLRPRTAQTAPGACPRARPLSSLFEAL